MNKIKKMPWKDVDRYIDIWADAYPGVKIVSPEDKKRLKDRFQKRSKDPRLSFWAMYSGSEMLGGILFWDYIMNFFGHNVLAGGGGNLAVDLMHKKEHVARDLMRYMFRHYRKLGAPLSVLWPFRPDFYKQMGCGLGSKGHVYKIKPADLPFGKSKKYVRFLGKADMKAVNDCHNRQVARTTGMIEETLVSRKIRFDFGGGLKYAGYVKNGRVEGYLIFDFQRGNEASFVDNYIKVRKLIYETPEALEGLMGFLHTQADQINRIIIHTSDDHFHHLFKDARNDTGNLIDPVYHESHVSGVGIMYRVLNTRQVWSILEDRNFGGETLRLKLTVKDSFLKENDGSLVIHFDDGRPQIKTGSARHDVELKIDIADFSSLIMGAVDLKSLYYFGAAKISKVDYLDRLQRLFATDQKPVCMTSF